VRDSEAWTMDTDSKLRRWLDHLVEVGLFFAAAIGMIVGVLGIQ